MAADEQTVRDANNAYLRSLPDDVCKCGHGRMEHYDGHDFCTWTVEDECACEQYEPKATTATTLRGRP